VRSIPRSNPFRSARDCALPLLAAVLLALPALAQSQSYPSRAVRIVVGFPAGNSPDIVARAVGDDLSKAWGQAVVVENRAGAGAILATEAVAKAAPDGHTLYLATLGALGLNPHLYKKLPYDPVRDFTGITFVSDNPFVLAVSPSIEAKNLQELLALARARPGSLNYGSGASFAQMLAEALKKRTGTSMTMVPYKGVQMAINDVIGGQVQVAFADLPAVLSFHRSGKARILGVTSARRSAVAPDLPTLAEQGLAGYDFATWYAFVAPAATPRPVIDKVHADMVRILERDDMKARLLALGLEVRTSRPEYVTELVKSEIAKWGPVVRDAGIEPQ
jgi:tripartite-type tricarboxylate transporter receptor subunit TctC